jgi:hypothetical protein
LTLLDQASSQFESGKYKASVVTLWQAEVLLRGSDDADGAFRLLELASKLREVTKGSLRDQCDQLVRRANKIGYRAGAIATIPACSLAGGFGFPIQRPQEGKWDLVFNEAQVFVHQVIDQIDAQTLVIGWDRLTVNLEAFRRKRAAPTLFIGGGIVAPIALAASLMNLADALGTDICTLVHVRSPLGELVLAAGLRPPRAVRQILSPVLDRLSHV